MSMDNVFDNRDELKRMVGIETEYKDLSESLEVTKALRLCNNGSIVGYRVKNIGDKPIQYTTEVWITDNYGDYVSHEVSRTLEKGNEADLSRQYLTLLVAKPEFSFELSNGKVVKGAVPWYCDKKKWLKSELTSYYFKFNEDSDQYNDSIEDLSIDIGETIQGKVVVKNEYIETFGFLESNNDTKRNNTEKVRGKHYTIEIYLDEEVTEASICIDIKLDKDGKESITKTIR